MQLDLTALFAAAIVGALAFSPASASEHRSRKVAREFQQQQILAGASAGDAKND
jgi:hypothetical protein